MRRSGRGCCSGCLWLFAIALLIYSWEGSSWPLRGLELLVVVLVVAGAAYWQRRASGARAEAAT